MLNSVSKYCIFIRRYTIVYSSQNQYVFYSSIGARRKDFSVSKSHQTSFLRYPCIQKRFNYRFLSTESTISSQSQIFTYISQCTPTNAVKTYIVDFHEVTGLPWWATVILSTFLLRSLLTLPLAIYQANIIAKIENISLLEMPEIAKNVQKEIALKGRVEGWSEMKAKLYFKKSMKEKWNALIIRDNCHPFKGTITLWFQLPTWIFFSAALRNLAYMLPYQTADAQILYLELAVGGCLWIPNLTQPDGTLILPMFLGLSNLAIIEIQAMMRLREPTRFQRYATNFFRFFSIALVPISATVPSVVGLYWTTSSVIGLCQNLLLMSNRVRKTFRIPDTPTTLDHPYRQLIYEIKRKSNSITNLLKKNN